MALEQEIQLISYNIQVLEEQANFLNEQLEYFSETLRGLRITQSTINGLQNLPENHEILVPIGNGAFLNAKVKDSSKILIAISKDIIMEKPLPDARDFTQKMMDNAKDALEKINEQRNKIMKKLDELKFALNQKVNAGSGEEQPSSEDSQ